LAGFEKLKIVIFLEFLLWPLQGVKELKYYHGGFVVLCQNCAKIVTCMEALLIHKILRQNYGEDIYLI